MEQELTCENLKGKTICNKCVIRWDKSLYLPVTLETSLQYMFCFTIMPVVIKEKILFHLNFKDFSGLPHTRIYTRVSCFENALISGAPRLPSSPSACRCCVSRVIVFVWPKY